MRSMLHTGGGTRGRAPRSDRARPTAVGAASRNTVLLLRENPIRFCREEMCVQVAHGLRHIALLNHKTNVDLRCALRNHANIYACVSDDIEYARGDTRLAMAIFPNQADDRLPLFPTDIGNLLQFREQ